jgi:hypothetical protein
MYMSLVEPSCIRFIPLQRFLVYPTLVYNVKMAMLSIIGHG